MNALLDNIVQPLVRRMGTAVGASFLTFGATTQQADQIETTVVLLLGILWDLGLSHFSRKVIKNKAIEAVFKVGR